MITGVDNGILTTDLDANGFNINNIGGIVPPPTGLVASDDSRLTDARDPLPGSVTNASVAAGAAIDQSKLLLDGDIPASWLGTTATTAAPGDEAELLINRNVANGYAGLDGTGKVDPANLPDDVGVGTVTSVDLSMPAEFTVSGNPIATSGTITVEWANVADGSWFGNATGGSAAPSFSTDPVPLSIIPDLPASKITTGTLDPARLPVAVGVGPSSSAGAVPDPGPAGDPTDYLARDMTYQPLPTFGAAYEPTLPDPTIVVLSSGGPDANVSPSSTIAGPLFFYKFSVSSPTSFTELVGSDTQSQIITVPTGETLTVYSAKVGYKNSNQVTYVAP